MNKIAKTTCAIALLALLAYPLAACSGSQGSKSGAASEGSPLDEGVREQIETVVAEARDAKFDNVTFDMRTETAVTSKDEEGNTQQQVTVTETKGELDRSSEKPRLHMGYESSNNLQLEKTSYDMYMDEKALFIKQGEQLYKNEIDDATLQNYATSITSVGSETEIEELLNVASSYTIEEKESGDTVITIVADVKKIEESSIIDTSSLPEGSSVATLVASYIIGPDSRFKSIRLMSSTTGAPTYRVDQSYQFSNYDTTVMPEWPDFTAYVAQQMGIETDADGRQYIVYDDGQTYYVDHIDENGTVYFSAS